MPRGPFPPKRPRTLNQIWRDGPMRGTVHTSTVAESGPAGPSIPRQPRQRTRLPTSAPDTELQRAEARQTGTRPPSRPAGTSGPWGPRDAENPEASPHPTFDDSGFQTSIYALASRIGRLPDDFKPQVTSIRKSAQNILESMRTDPADVREGERFLRRYLPATHHLLDTFERLSRSDPDTDRLAENRARSIQLLTRLEAAFREEHANLLRNDVMNFSADMNTLDKLLKMEGH